MGIKENDYSEQFAVGMRRNSSMGLGGDAPKLNDFCKGIQIKLSESPNQAIKSNRKLSTKNSQGSIERKCAAGEDMAIVMTQQHQKVAL